MVCFVRVILGCVSSDGVVMLCHVDYLHHHLSHSTITAYITTSAVDNLMLVYLCHQEEEVLSDMW